MTIYLYLYQSSSYLFASKKLAFLLKVLMTTNMLRLHLLFRFLSLFVIFPSSFPLVVGLSGCHPHHIQALMHFKNEFDSGGCNQTDYFIGVHCDNMTGEVTKLQLPSGCLSGTLNPNSSLFRLHHLRYLNLSSNNFTSSSLPYGFGNLNKLEVLSLSSNGFIGQVPSSFSNLSRLTELYLDHNELTGGFPLVQNLTNLSILNLSLNHFSGPIPSSLLTMPFLSYLNLDENHLTDPVEVRSSSTSSRLKTLKLRKNPFEGKILDLVSNFTNLKYLDLSFLNLNISYPIDIRIFSPLKSLVHLDLSGNSISPISLRSESDVPMNLEILGLSDCGISQFPNFLRSLRNLEHIKLSNNKINGKVPEWFWNLPSLNSVSLVNNSFTSFQGSVDVLVNSSVRLLDLALNHFKGPFPNPPLSIVLLSAWNNSFTGNIPLSICNRSSLTGLDLSYNNFNGSIPRCLSNLQNSLLVVNLRKNNLEGSLPDIFYNGTLLRTLDVGYNQLTGKLPRSLLNCSSMQFISLDHNRIKDTFPFWLNALPDLQVLTLRSNKFYGPISPPDQEPLAFPKLRILEISNNNFTGTLPPNYFVNWIASSLEINEDGRIYMGDYNTSNYSYDDTLDLQYKGLFMEQGKVLTTYATIDFSGNKLEGQIPESIGLLKALIALNLSNNAFTGHIPLSLANVTELESLDLSNNQLSGTIPKGLERLSFLAYISVAHNKLKGEIPQGTQITGQPKSSFEGNAGLCGLPLEQSCFGSNAPPMQQQSEEEKEEEEEEVLNWKAVTIGYGTGLLLVLSIAQVIASCKPEWLVKITGLNKRRIG